MHTLPASPSWRLVVPVLAVWCALSGVRARAQAGAVDPTFTPGPPFVSVSKLALQADGKVYIAGSFKSYLGTATTGLLRLNADGTVDSGFDLGTGFVGLLGVLPPTFNTVVSSGAGVLVGGLFDKVNGQAQTNLVRLLGNGAVDTAFAPRVDNSVVVIAVQSDGRILIGGAFKNVNGVARNALARLNANGTLDTTFNPQWGTVIASSPRVILFQPDGKLLVGGGHASFAGGLTSRGVVRLNADGTTDDSFQSPLFGFTTESVGSMVLQADGRIVIAGLFSNLGGTPHKGIARLNANGSLDTTWPGAGAGAGGLEGVSVVAPTSGDRIFVGGGFATLNGSGPAGIQRLNADGSRDASFEKPAGSTTFSVADLVAQPDGHVIISGVFTLGTDSKTVLRLVGSGTVTVPPPTITTQPSDLAAPLNATGRSLTVVAAGSPPLSYAWFKDGGAEPVRTDPTLPFSQLRESHEGEYRVVVTNPGGSVTSVVARVSILQPARITTQPVAVTAALGEPATFSVGVSGTPPITYQWRKDFVDIPGANGPTFTIPAVTAADAGGYSVAVGNALGGETSANVVLRVTIAPPTIVRQPLGQTVDLAETNLTARILAGRRLRLTVLGGLAPWIPTGVYEIAFTETTYASPVGGALATVSTGVYSVGRGTAPVATLVNFGTFFPTGEPAVLTLVPNGIFEFNKANLVPDQNGRWELIPAYVPPAGPTVVLSVEATGPAPLTYQWRRNGGVIADATGPILTLTNVRAADLGDYTVDITNPGGTVFSAAARVDAAASAVQLAPPVLANGRLEFGLPTVVGRAYQVEFRNGLGQGNWATVQTIPGDGSVRNVSIPTPGTSGVVRVGVR